MASRLVLVIGDLHIPDRAIDIPAKFKKLLTPNKIGQTLCLGNLTDSATYTYLRTLSADLKIIRGRFDSDAPSLPLSGVVTHGALRIGFLEGFSTVVPAEADVLLAEALRLDVDVLCWGGGAFDAFEYGGRFFVRPGSATGCGGWEGEGEGGTPSFCLMDVQGISLTLYVYQLKKDEKGVENVGVEKVTFTKKVDG